MPFLGYKTYYRIVGEPSTHRPLTTLAGDPKLPSLITTILKNHFGL